MQNEFCDFKILIGNGMKKKKKFEKAIHVS